MNTAFPDLAEEREILDSVNLRPLVDAVSKPYAGVGPKPQDRAPIVRAHFMAYLHKTVIGTVTALHWTLMNNPAFRAVCGFNGTVPSRPTFSRVFTQMAEHPEIVERIMDELVREARRVRPDLGEEIAVDATPVHSYSDGNKRASLGPGRRVGNAPQGQHQGRIRVDFRLQAARRGRRQLRLPHRHEVHCG